MNWSPAQITHGVTTIATLVIVAILITSHDVTPGAGLAALGIVTGTSLGIGANPPSPKADQQVPPVVKLERDTPPA